MLRTEALRRVIGEHLCLVHARLAEPVCAVLEERPRLHDVREQALRGASVLGSSEVGIALYRS